MEICWSAAKVYAGKDWHKLSSKEQELVDLLERGGFLVPNKPANGFVGKVAGSERKGGCVTTFA